MVNCKVKEDKLVCRICNIGYVYKGHTESGTKVVYGCDHCDAHWLEPNYVGRKSKLRWIRTEIEDHSFDWYKSITEDPETDAYMCPLLDVILFNGDCYDINMVRHDYIKKEVLDYIEEVIHKKIDIEYSNAICENCMHGINKTEETWSS